MAESDGLQAVAQHGANADQPVTIAQQRENVAAGGRRNVNGGEIAAAKQVEHQMGITAVVFLPAAGELAYRQRVANQQLMAEIFHGAMEPQRVAGRFHANHGSRRKLRVKCPHVVALVLERDLVYLTVRRIHAADCLRANMQIHSDVHCHPRLLCKPMPNDSGREYQHSPQGARVS